MHDIDDGVLAGIDVAALDGLILAAGCDAAAGDERAGEKASRKGYFGRQVGDLLEFYGNVHLAGWDCIGGARLA
ncbi:MAG TPA: hypothetical protein VMZ28_06310 [Kofleriaceae bacterium]|nr:hypothetical protein [Kofleriaceae bacterium]